VLGQVSGRSTSIGSSQKGDGPRSDASQFPGTPGGPNSAAALPRWFTFHNVRQGHPPNTSTDTSKRFAPSAVSSLCPPKVNVRRNV
jgi:hypothetical protein